MMKWFEKAGSEQDVVMSTRIRLARNLSNYPFVGSMDPKQKEEVIEKVKEAVALVSLPEEKKLQFIAIDSLPETERFAMAERHIISYELAQGGEGKGLLLANDESISIMINEEDHLRIQVLASGLDFKESYDLANKIDDVLDERLSFAFREDLGYLTQCPTNIGTGLRASVMLHLPALEQGRELQRIVSLVPKLGLTIRGTYGEGSKVKGAIYQISNQVTLGISEEDAIKNLESITRQIVEEERRLRNQLCENEAFVNEIMRALGTLHFSTMLSGDEFLSCASLVRIAISQGLEKTISLDKLDALIFTTGAAGITRLAGEELSSYERDKYRASYIKDHLNS